MNSVSPSSREQLLGANADVVVLWHEQPQLVRQVEVGLVVRRGREQDALAVVLLDVLLDGPVALALAVAQVVALVDQHEPVAAQFGQLLDDRGQREDLGHAGGTAVDGSPPTSGPGSSGR